MITFPTVDQLPNSLLISDLHAKFLSSYDYTENLTKY